MGHNKLLDDLHGVPLVRHAIEAVAAGGCAPVIVVYSDPKLEELALPSAVRVRNPTPELGLASSLVVGLDAVDEFGDVAAILIALGDQPMVGEWTVRAVVDAWRREPVPALAAEYPDGIWRPPVVVSRTLWPALRRLRGDVGAKSILSGEGGLQTIRVAGSPADVDTEDDLARLRRS